MPAVFGSYGVDLDANAEPLAGQHRDRFRPEVAFKNLPC